MPLPDLAPALRNTLLDVAAIMTGARERWWIIASAAAALHGAAPIEVADVDVLLSVPDANTILPRLGLAVGPGTANERFRSARFATWQSTALPVDFMADFHARDFQRPDGPKWNRVMPQTRVSIDLSGARLYIPSRVELHALFLSFGRPKDLARARLLAALPAPDQGQAYLGDAR
ncbi:hypothetical protein [Novosphingobium sp. 9]|uniref:hypothetical protein n=1 Tax=Novosphingobium sp. 9 TaxID=2025349 RepID=UPI0021B6439E|nr:hypothetical protein [Novosphingobium sp. 9]